jgi:hypothetical protein
MSHAIKCHVQLVLGNDMNLYLHVLHVTKCHVQLVLGNYTNL